MAKHSITCIILMLIYSGIHIHRCYAQDRVDQLEERVAELEEELEERVAELQTELQDIQVLVDGEEFIRGPPGATGASGSSGSRGAEGARGSQGPKGQKGDKGSRGARGPKGQRGQKGPKGPTGERGPRGQTGNPGADGQPGSAVVHFPWQDQDVGPCDFNPCINDGTCVTDAGQSLCECSLPYMGAYCDIHCLVLFGNKCFFLSSQKGNWPLALEYCSGAGGHLAEITSAALNTQIKANVSQAVWLGAHTNSDDDWVWAHSEISLWYIDWYPGHPASFIDSCIRTVYPHDMRWQSASCETHIIALYGLCELDLGV